MFTSGHFLTRKRFVELVRAALVHTDVDQCKYYGHSFLIRAATTAAARGVEDSVIRKVGERGVLSIRMPSAGTTDRICRDPHYPVNSMLCI